MTARELLEAAAKAAQIRPDLDCQWNGLGLWFSGGGDGVFWNPLTDDGDALRLAVKLRIEVEPWIHGDSEYARAACGEVMVDEPHDGDPCSATRRAIVRAAAAMGGAQT